MSGDSLQIQSVLYENRKESLLRALDSLDNALEVYRRTHPGYMSDVAVWYGDASAKRIFSESEIDKICARYEHAFKLHYIFFKENTGTAKGHNLLGENCLSEFMMIMNPDVLLSPDYFDEIMFPFFSSSLDVGMCEARQVPIEHPKEYDVYTGETSWASTAAALFKTKDFHTLDGFDAESFFMYCDDLDFSWRMRLLGKKIIYCPNAIVFHAKKLSISGAWCPTFAEVYYSAEAALLMAHKWSNDSRCDEILRAFQGSAEKTYRDVAEAFSVRKENGKLPRQLDKSHSVATFVGNGYAVHRFNL